MELENKNKASQQRIGGKYLLPAAVLAVAVHLLLLCSFRSPVNSSSGQTGLTAPVVKIDLTGPKNRQLALWMKNHDPSLMTRVDKKSGYSMVLPDSLVHPEPDDLPLAPILTAPVMPKASEVPLVQLHGDPIPGGLPESDLSTPVYFRAEKDSVRSAALEKITAALGKAEFPGTAAAVSVTLPPMRLGLKQEPELTVSSGSKKLDNIAIAASKIFQEKCADNECSGVLTFVWRSDLRSKQGEVKK